MLTGQYRWLGIMMCILVYSIHIMIPNVTQVFRLTDP